MLDGFVEYCWASGWWARWQVKKFGSSYDQPKKSSTTTKMSFFFSFFFYTMLYMILQRTKAIYVAKNSIPKIRHKKLKYESLQRSSIPATHTGRDHILPGRSTRIFPSSSIQTSTRAFPSSSKRLTSPGLVSATSTSTLSTTGIVLLPVVPCSRASRALLASHPCSTPSSFSLLSPQSHSISPRKHKLDHY